MAPRESNTVRCPKCQAVAYIATPGTAAYYDPAFKCKACGHKGVLRWKRKQKKA